MTNKLNNFLNVLKKENYVLKYENFESERLQHLLMNK